MTVTTDPIADTVLGAQVNKRLTALALQDDAWSFADQAPEQLRYAIDPLARREAAQLLVRQGWQPGRLLGRDLI
ncbi:hypothetical protein LP419_40525 [Massilia sp. H-1]|nr:hypothetical protein LP419_40525 [Massilia sp. H-1]